MGAGAGARANQAPVLAESLREGGAFSSQLIGDQPARPPVAVASPEPGKGLLAPSPFLSEHPRRRLPLGW
jgi:hypothetical protein